MRDKKYQVRLRSVKCKGPSVRVLLEICDNKKLRVLFLKKDKNLGDSSFSFKVENFIILIYTQRYYRAHHFYSIQIHLSHKRSNL